MDNWYKIKKPSKKLIKICESLGEDYKIRRIDFFQDIVREIGDYEVEIGGLNLSSKIFNAQVVVVAKPNITIKIYDSINSFENLVKILAYLEAKLKKNDTDLLCKDDILKS